MNKKVETEFNIQLSGAPIKGGSPKYRADGFDQAKFGKAVSELQPGAWFVVSKTQVRAARQLLSYGKYLVPHMTIGIRAAKQSDDFIVVRYS